MSCLLFKLLCLIIPFAEGSLPSPWPRPSWDDSVRGGSTKIQHGMAKDMAQRDAALPHAVGAVA